MKIKMTVSTGWANGEHVDYQELPPDWDNLSHQEKENYIHACAGEYMHEVCSAHGELVGDDDE